MAAHDDLATKLVAFSDDDLESCYDDVTAACVASRCLSLSDLDALTDALAAAANRRQAVEAVAAGSSIVDRDPAAPAIHHNVFTHPNAAFGPGAWAAEPVSPPRVPL